MHVLLLRRSKHVGQELAPATGRKQPRRALNGGPAPRRSQLTLLEGRVFHLVGPISIVCDETLGGGPGGVGNMGLDVVASDLRQGP